MSPTTALEPSPGAAPAWRRFVAQTVVEVRQTLRNGEQLLLTVVIPVAVLVVGSQISDVRTVLPGVFALAVMSTAFTGLAIGTGFERRYGVLKYLGSTPLSRTGLVSAKTQCILVIIWFQLVLLLGVGLALGWSAPGPVGGAFTATTGLVHAGTAAFAGLGLLMAGTLRAEATLAAANLVYLLLLLGGAVVIPIDRYPDALQPVIGLLPSGALGEGLRQALSDGGSVWGQVTVLLVWAAVGLGLAARTFRWE